MFRTCTILAVTLAVLAGGTLGTSNGMVLCVDADGRVAVEAPHIRHAHSHARGADHDRHDHGEDADHADLHEMMSSCSDSFVSGQALERSSSSIAIHQHHAGLKLSLPPCFRIAPAPSSPTDVLAVPTFRGGTAHLELACLASLILLV